MMLFILFALPACQCFGNNPVFRDVFTADPAAMVVGDTVYVYVGHDAAKPGQFFVMPEWLCYSSTDMQTWTPHGPVMRPEDFSFARPDVAWAAHMTEKDGKYYFYTTLRRNNNNEHCIGVAVSDSPLGPFKDARGTPLITDGMTTDSSRPNADIDPTVFIDDDGTAWMMWGNGDFYLVKLKPNMIELDGPIRKIPHKNVAEGPWLFKRGGLYYNVYAADVPGNPPEKIAYATAETITGPWTYRGLVTGSAKKGFTIHPAVIEFKGQWYFFYHDGSNEINGQPGGDCRRSVCLEYLYFNEDGTIKPIVQTQEGVSLKAESPEQPTPDRPLKLHEIDASQVKLLPGSPFYARQELHRRGYLASFEPDKLLFHYRALAKLPQAQGVAGGYGGWDSGFIRGNMAGHFLSAASRMAAATGDASFRKKVEYMVTELAKCQDALNQNGYLAAFPSGAFDRLEGKPGNSGGVVVPYYTIHKIMAGLLDAYHYLDNDQALDVAEKMADYFEHRLASLGSDEIEKIFRTDSSRNPHNEFGAMSDVLAELYEVTGDRRHLTAAQLFNRPWFMNPLVAGEDKLYGLHANTHVAQAVGIARCGNLSGDVTEQKASEIFWKKVTQQHMFVIGGNSFKEWFDKPGIEAGPSIDEQKRLPATTAESCNTHNMLKLTTRLFERTPRAEYADYFERALYNHLLATVAPDTGAVTYFTPLYGNFRTYLNGTQCCVGSGIENTPRYNEGIYIQGDSSLWINLYIPSELNLRDGGLSLRQEGDMANAEPVRFTILKSMGKSLILNFRIPHWISGPAVLTLNGEVIEQTDKASSYVSIKREWKAGDVVTLTLPAGLRLEHAKDSSSMVSIFFGPVLLAGELGRENMPNDWADKDAYLEMPPVTVPEIKSVSANPADWLEAVEGKPLVFRAHDVGPADGILFRPLFDLHHQYYAVYWNCPLTEFENEKVL